MPTAVVYQWRNLENGKVYIGSAINVKRRKTAHLSCLRRGVSGHKHLQAAWNKYGERAFVFEVLEIVDNPARILEAEQSWINRYAAGDLYNLLSKAGSVAGYRHTSEARAAIGKALTGRQRPPDVVERVRQSQIGISKTPEARENISQAMLRYIAEHGCNIGGAQPPEIRLKMSVAAKAYLASNPNNFLGKSHTSKTKELLRQATLAQLASSPHPMLGKVHSEQTRAKLRAAWVRRKQRATEGAKT